MGFAVHYKAGGARLHDHCPVRVGSPAIPGRAEAHENRNCSDTGGIGVEDCNGGSESQSTCCNALSLPPSLHYDFKCLKSSGLLPRLLLLPVLAVVDQEPVST